MKALLLTLTLLFTLNINAQQFIEVQSQDEQITIIIDSIKTNVYVSSSGQYYVIATSKKGNKYRKYLGKPLNKYFYKENKKYMIYTNSKNTKYWYFTYNNNKFHKHYLKKS